MGVLAPADMDGLMLAVMLGVVLFLMLALTPRLIFYTRDKSATSFVALPEDMQVEIMSQFVPREIALATLALHSTRWSGVLPLTEATLDSEHLTLAVSPHLSRLRRLHVRTTSPLDTRALTRLTNLSELKVCRLMGGGGGQGRQFRTPCPKSFQ